MEVKRARVSALVPFSDVAESVFAIIDGPRGSAALLKSILVSVDMENLPMEPLHRLIEYAHQEGYGLMKDLLRTRMWTEVAHLPQMLDLNGFVGFADLNNFKDPTFKQVYIMHALRQNFVPYSGSEILAMLPDISIFYPRHDKLSPTVKFCLASAQRFLALPVLRLPPEYEVPVHIDDIFFFRDVPRRGKQAMWASSDRQVTPTTATEIIKFLKNVFGNQRVQITVTVENSLKMGDPTMFMTDLKMALINISNCHKEVDDTMESLWDICRYLAETLDVLSENGNPVMFFSRMTFVRDIQGAYMAAVTAAYTLKPDEALTLVGEGNPPVTPFQTFFPFLSAPTLEALTIWTKEGVVTAQACFAALFRDSGFTSTGLVRLRWLTGPKGTHHGLRPIRNRLVQYLVPPPKARAISAEIAAIMSRGAPMDVIAHVIDTLPRIVSPF